MRPAIRVDRIDSNTNRIGPISLLSSRFLYPMAMEEMSKTKLAAVNPRKWSAVGLRMKLRRVAMSPIADAHRGLLVHQIVRIRRDAPTMSQRMGRRVACQNIGVIVTFNMAQVEAARDTATISLVPSFGIAYLT